MIVSAEKKDFQVEYEQFQYRYFDSVTDVLINFFGHLKFRYLTSFQAWYTGCYLFIEN